MSLEGKTCDGCRYRVGNQCRRNPQVLAIRTYSHTLGSGGDYKEVIDYDQSWEFPPAEIRCGEYMPEWDPPSQADA